MTTYTRTSVRCDRDNCTAWMLVPASVNPTAFAHVAGWATVERPHYNDPTRSYDLHYCAKHQEAA